MADIDLGMNLYEFNKLAMKEFKILDPIILNKKISEIASYMMDNCNTSWYMLLCHDRRDYTVFHMTDNKNLEQLNRDLKDTLTNRGKILDITQLKDKNFEIWIRDDVTDENFVYYLFDYQYGIIEV